MSLDGCIALASGESQWITGPRSRQQGHQLRHQCDVILVGMGTVRADNPQLTTRLEHEQEPRHPIRVVLDSRADLPMLAICERALVVNPDASLSAMAGEKGWEIVRPAKPWRSPLDRALRMLALLFGLGSDPGGINAARP